MDNLLASPPGALLTASAPAIWPHPNSVAPSAKEAAFSSYLRRRQASRRVASLPAARVARHDLNVTKTSRRQRS